LKWIRDDEATPDEREPERAGKGRQRGEERDHDEDGPSPRRPGTAAGRLVAADRRPGLSGG
jgi:hypothetical protein